MPLIGRPTYTYLPCSEVCDCIPAWLPLGESHRAHRSLPPKQAA
jgi:hypothetical protein